MNKIFKVVWSKTKECYVVVSEVAKNNGGKKKVLASVLAALAVVGAGAAGTPVQAAQDLHNKVNISPTGTLAGGSYPNTNSVSEDSIVVGYGNTTAGAAGYGHVAYGFGNTATEDTTTAIGGGNKATGGSATAVGSFNTASGRASVAIGNVSIASAEDSIAIGNRANSNPANTDRGSGKFSIAVGRESWAKGTDNISIGHKAETNSSGDSIAMGRESKANQANAVAIGPQADANGWGGIAMGREAAVSANFATAIGYKANASGSNSISVGKENTAKAFDAVAIGHNNTSRTYSAVSLGTDNTSDATYGLSDAQVAALPYDPTNNATLTDPRKTDPRRGITSTIAIGRNNVAGNVETIAIGTNTKATMTDAIAIGARAEATGDYALAIGGAAGGFKVAAAEYGTAVGVRANAANRGAAFGAGSNAGSQKSVAIGYTAKASAQKATSNYEFSGSNGTPSPAGYKTETITVNSASAPAGGAVAGNYYDAGSGVAIGNGATVSDESDQAVVVGADAKTNGNAHYSVVLGSGSHADASDGFVAGHGSYVKARESIAIGSGANVSGNENIRSQAIGYGATVTGTGAYDATAIGATAQVTGVQGGVALGSGSLLSRTTNSNENAGWNSKSLNGTVIRNRAYTADLTGHNDQWDSGSINTGAVSVGNDIQKRQIINVAAGNKDTDAVNVAQLKNVGVRVGADTNTATITVGTNTSNVAADFLAYNGQLNIKGDSNRITTVSENDANGKDANVNVKFDYDGLVKSKAGSSVTVNQKIEGGKTVFEIDAAAGGATSTESVVKKAAATNDTNIADISVADNKNTGDVGAKYEVSVSRNAVKDAAREAVTVNNGGTTKADGSYTADSNNPITVNPVKDDTNHNTTYEVKFDGNKAAKQIPLTYKANGNGAKTVTLEKGLDFTNGTNTTAEIGNDGVVKYNLNKDVDLSNTGSLKVGGTTVNNGGITIKAPTTPGTTTTDVKLTNTGLDNGGNTITNVAEGQNNTDAVN
ncbi:MAG: ESPR-type extended signal peptide-containing protein, partial [Veillonella sp.]|uniref:ESPR-type extended signal peptide-containing protein n=1 Tax=Veillonella sp. TaxID=1926307 RepID=UPI00290D4C95